MKIAKKFMTLALATALGVGCATVGVSAAPSTSNASEASSYSYTKKITVASEQSKIYEVLQKIEDAKYFADLQEKYPTLADAFKKVNDGKMDVTEFVSVLQALADADTTDEADKADLEEVIAKLDKKQIVTNAYEFDVLDFDKAKKNDDGKYEVQIEVPSITDTMKGIQLLVYSKDGTKHFEIIDPISIDKDSKTLTVALNDGDFFMVIADAE